MNGYFKPLRRKIGLMTLLIACVFTAGWVRSDTQEDEISVTVFSLVNNFASNSGNISWWRWYDPNATEFFEWDTRRNGKHHATDDLALNAILTGGLQSKRGRFTNRTATGVTTFFDGDQVVHRVEKPKPAPAPPTVHNIHYRSIVVPLTLISVWLLLLKPRTGTGQLFHT